MCDMELLAERLMMVLESLERIPRRFEGIAAPSDFTDTAAGVDRMDAICMMLIAAGEELKKIDIRTEGKLLSGYPGVNWRDVIRVRDFLAHGYYRVNPEQLFAICRDDVPVLVQTVRKMIEDLQ